MKREILKKTVVFLGLLLPFLFLVSCSKNEDVTEITVDSKNPVITKIADDLNADSIKKTVQWLQDKKTRYYLSSNRKQIATELKNKFVQLGYVNSRIDSFFLSSKGDYGQAYETWQYNVIARLEGSLNIGKVYVIGAHYDSYCYDFDPFIMAPGADDNASGVAGILEIARVFKKNGFVPKSAIEFVAFAAEEAYMKGSADYAAKAAAKNIGITLMINLDMISYQPNPNPNSWSVKVINFENTVTQLNQIVSCGKIYTRLAFINDNAHSNLSDSYPFFQKGYKALFFESSQFHDPYYHMLEDVVAHYNYPYCREVSAVSCAYLVQENL